MSVKEYLENLDKRRYTTFMVNSKGKFYIENGIEIPMKEFESFYPLATKVKVTINHKKGENPDKSRSYLD